MDQGSLTLYIAQSLDGYIATEAEGLDWLDAVEGLGDNGYAAFYDTVDTLFLGRKTYDWILAQNLPEFPYAGKDCYVFSRTAGLDTEHVTFVHEDAAAFAAKWIGGRRIWLVGGGNLLHTFLSAGLVDTLILTIAPVLLGTGIPLFLEPGAQANLRLKEIKRYGQFAQLHYQVIKSENHSIRR